MRRGASAGITVVPQAVIILGKVSLGSMGPFLLLDLESLQDQADRYDAVSQIHARLEAYHEFAVRCLNFLDHYYFCQEFVHGDLGKQLIESDASRGQKFPWTREEMSQITNERAIRIEAKCGKILPFDRHDPELYRLLLQASIEIGDVIVNCCGVEGRNVHHTVVKAAWRIASLPTNLRLDVPPLEYQRLGVRLEEEKHVAQTRLDATAKLGTAPRSLSQPNGEQSDPSSDNSRTKIKQEKKEESVAVQRGAEAEATKPTTPIEVHVTLTQAAAIVNKSKRTLERLKNDGELPAPAVKGGKGRADEWRWSDIRPILETEYRRQLPGTFPTDRFMRR